MGSLLRDWHGGLVMMPATRSRAFCGFERLIVGGDMTSIDLAMKSVWQAHGKGALSDTEAQALSDLAQSRRTRRSPHAPDSVGAALIKRFQPRRLQRSPDREASLRRRRELASMSPMPRHLANHFTEGQRSALAVIAGEVKHHGRCDLPLDKIAALAGVCRTTARNAINEAKRLGLVRVISRPRPGQKNLTNVVEIVSPEWRTWLKRGPTAHRPTGCKTLSASKILRPTMSTERKIAFERRAEGGPFAPAKDHLNPARTCNDRDR
ncbi:hypothetical protein [Ancylobacter sp. FA202]|uniref:hypothetical protein n=1 Tax=Ancylobacter sp. FA202 TaxID=1111106 RepID=UPI001FDAC486|nr:hypothetical protein [Ancylobacter sp. FA202]